MPESPEQAYFRKRFELALSTLNVDQHKAVDQLEDPVLVLAGPGTGKTHILSARIGRILLESDAQSHNILCLTYTDAGVFAMRERLLELIGPEAHRVHIFTFHAFCNRIIQENTMHFGRRDMEPIGSLEKVELIRELIDELPPGHLLRQNRSGDPYVYEKTLSGLFDTMKSENWTPQRIGEAVRSYLDSLPERNEFIYQRKQGSFQKGDLKVSKFETEQERMNILLAAAELFLPFEKKMRARRRYDYGDMIGWVLRAFKEKPFLLRRYQEQYLYFLVDEFQDTNGAQNAILQHLLDYWEFPNVFIVGDDDQSIYEFQGARLQYLSDFIERYSPHLHIFVLKENYRSTQPILDWAHRLIQFNSNRIVHKLDVPGISKDLVSSHPDYKDRTGEIRVLEYPDKQQELAGLLESLSALHREGYPLEEVAVIYPRHSQAKDLMELLDRRGIPYEARKPVNILELPLMKRWRLLLEYLHAELIKPYSGEALLFEILHHSYWNIATTELARLAAWRAAQKERPHWRVMFQGEMLELSEHFRIAGATLEDLLQVQANQSLPELLEACLNRSGMLREVLDSPQLSWQVQVLQTFMRFVNDELLRQPNLNLGDLLGLLEKMRANNLPISLYQTGSATRGVQLVTAHSSKGLEFKIVYLFDLLASEWESRRKPGGTKIFLPDTLTQSDESDLEETQRRLFYVAITRAREGLFLSYARRDSQQRDLQRTQYLDELDPIRAYTQIVQADPEALLRNQLLSLGSPEAPQLEPFDRDQIGRLLENFTLSVTGFNQFLRCPLSFFYQQVLRVPVLERGYVGYGLAMHEALERFFQRGMLGKEPGLPPVSFLLQAFEEAFQRKQALFSAPVYETRLLTGKTHLEAYYQQHADQWPADYLPEQYIAQVQVEGVPLRGSIDRVDFLDPYHVRVIDYKTGKPQKRLLQPPSEEEPYGGSYWRQLLFYKILFEAQQRWPHSVQSGMISYLEPDKSGVLPDFEIRFNHEDVQTLKQHIKTVYQRILDQDFYQGCGENSCSWCTFVRERQPVALLNDPDLEILDDGGM